MARAIDTRTIQAKVAAGEQKIWGLPHTNFHQTVLPGPPASAKYARIDPPWRCIEDRGPEPEKWNCISCQSIQYCQLRIHYIIICWCRVLIFKQCVCRTLLPIVACSSCWLLSNIPNAKPSYDTLKVGCNLEFDGNLVADSNLLCSNFQNHIS